MGQGVIGFGISKLPEGKIQATRLFAAFRGKSLADLYCIRKNQTKVYGVENDIDVYKRQSLYSAGIVGIAQILRTLLVPLMPFAAGFDVAGIINLLLNIPLFLLAVSYTHLDVYKRQTWIS